MTKCRFRSCILSPLLLFFLQTPVIAQRSADLVLRGGDIYTVDAARSWARALAVEDGQIVYVGTDSGAQGWIGSETQVIELNGRMVLPGFHDAHVHPVSGGVELLQCDLNRLETRAQILDEVLECAAEGDPDSWLVGGGWNLPIFPDGVAKAATLDSIVPDRPVYLSSSDAHSAWVNTRALELAGISAATPAPPEGRIERDPRTGEPIGTLRESAMDLVSRLLPPTSDEQRREGLRRALEMANGFGITSLVEANADHDALTAYAAAEREGWLTGRVVASHRVDPGRGVEQVDDLVALRDRFQTARFRPVAAKIFADGVIEGRTAALLEPYVGTPGESGTINFSPERLQELAKHLDEEGFQIHVHAIGDRAIRMSLDAIEAARLENGDRDARHQLAHIQLWDPADIGRLRELRVVANFQPLWAYADSYITELTEPVLGAARSRWLYPIRTVLESGAVVAAGSDWSVTSMNPLLGIQVAVTRQPLDGSAPPWIPQERISVADAIAAYTINGAYLMRQESETGSIEVGKAGDLIVLDRNLFEIAPSRIGRTEVLATWLAGELVFESARWAEMSP